MVRACCCASWAVLCALGCVAVQTEAMQRTAPYTLNDMVGHLLCTALPTPCTNPMCYLADPAAFGILLWEMVTCQRAFSDTPTLQVRWGAVGKGATSSQRHVRQVACVQSGSFNVWAA